MRFSNVANAMSVVACSAVLWSAGNLPYRADAQYLKATIRSATEEEIREMNEILGDGEVDGSGRQLQPTTVLNETFIDVVDFEFGKACGSEEDIKEALEAAYLRFYADLFQDFGTPGCGEEFEKETESFAVYDWEEALICDDYFKGRNLFLDEENPYPTDRLLRKKNKSRGKGRRKGKCNGCNKKRRRMTEETVIIDLSVKEDKGRRLQECSANLQNEIRQISGFDRARVAVNVDQVAQCDIKDSEDCADTEACCGEPECFCETPAVSECELNGCCIPNAPEDFCAGVGDCGFVDLCPTEPICPAANPQTTSTTVQTQNETYVLDLITETSTDDQFTCASGCLTLSSLTPPYNILFNLDISGSTDGNVINAEVDSTINFVQDLVDVPVLDNSNVDFALITFNGGAQFRGEFNIADPNNSSAIDPTLLSTLEDIRDEADGQTNFEAALQVSVQYFSNSPSGRSNVMYFLSDGQNNVGGSFDDEVTQLDALNTTRFAIGILEGSSLAQLNLIDNTGGAQQINNTEDLSDTLLGNSIVGVPVDFEIRVNGVVEPDIDVSSLQSSPLGYFFGDFELDGLDPRDGADNEITAVVVMDPDGNTADGSDEVVIATTNSVPGTA